MNARRTAALILAAAALMALNAGAYAEKEPEMAAGGAALIEQNTGTVICAKEAHKKRPMASTTKIMTALIVIENCSLGFFKGGIKLHLVAAQHGILFVKAAFLPAQVGYLLVKLPLLLFVFLNRVFNIVQLRAVIIFQAAIGLPL